MDTIHDSELEGSWKAAARHVRQLDWILDFGVSRMRLVTQTRRDLASSWTGALSHVSLCSGPH